MNVVRIPNNGEYKKHERDQEETCRFRRINRVPPLRWRIVLSRGRGHGHIVAPLSGAKLRRRHGAGKQQ